MSTPNYPGIGEIGGDLGTLPKAPVKVVKPPSETDALLARAERAEEEAREDRQALRDLRTAPPPPPQRLAPEGPPEPGDMPDPVKDAGAFRVWTDATRAYDGWKNEQHTNAVKAGADREARSRLVIDAFLTTHPKYRNLRDQVLQFYHQAALELGITAIPENTNTLDGLVLKKVTELVKSAAATVDDLPTGKEGEEVDEGALGEGRTGGLSGGSQETIKSSPPPSEEDGIPIKSLFDVMRDRQAKSGLF